jgi:thiamine phosphate synthase YjbQ (UPF0047 family)
MKSHLKLLTVTGEKNHVRIDITQTVKDEVTVSGMKDGLMLIRCMHSSMLMYIQDDDTRRLEFDGNNITISITDSKPDLGYWEKIIIDNYNAKREKNVIIKIIGE